MSVGYEVHCLQLQAGLSLGLEGRSVTMPLVWLLLILLASSQSPVMAVMPALVVSAGRVSTWMDSSAMCDPSFVIGLPVVLFDRRWISLRADIDTASPPPTLLFILSQDSTLVALW